ncbi:MAG: hypothetical protein IPM26_17265 [Saprospiraceae bacterium]|nr:hypothetical protein [Saprospiraceae bacterium]
MDRGNATLLKNPARYLAVVGLSIMFLQSLAALWYYDLRMYFVDAPFMVFRIIQLDSLSLQVGRFGAFITQFFPYIMQKTGFSLENILRGYSVAFSLFPLVVAWILFRIQQYPWVSLLALYFTMFCTDAWFWPNNEIHQGGLDDFLRRVLVYAKRAFERHLKTASLWSSFLSQYSVIP